MLFVDHIFMILLLVVQPLYGVFEARRHDALEIAGRPLNRIRYFRETMLVEWAFLAALLAAWMMLNRPLAGLGFSTSIGPGFWVGIVIVALLTGHLVYAWRWATRASQAEKDEQAKLLGKMVRYLPHTRRELRSFFGVSVTAGIVEEIVYRGFMFWYLAHVMPLWLAVGVSSVVFGLAHSYQGMNGVLRVTLIGLGFGALYVGTGSIWLPIVAHILIDALQGTALHEILRADDDDPEFQSNQPTNQLTS